MTRDDLIFAFNHTKSDYLLAAAESMRVKSRPAFRLRLRYAIIAATFVLLVAMIPIIVMLANRTPTPPPPQPPQPPTHLSITDIPGATVYDATDYFEVSDRNITLVSPEHYVEILKTAPSAIGIAKHISTVTIPHNGLIYSITVFDLTISTPFNQFESGQTIRLINSCVYFEDGVIASRCGLDNAALAAIKKPNAFYVVSDFKKIPKILTINNNQYDLSKYADFYLTEHHETDGEKIQYLGADIYFSEIQDKTS